LSGYYKWLPIRNGQHQGFQHRVAVIISDYTHHPSECNRDVSPVIACSYNIVTWSKSPRIEMAEFNDAWSAVAVPRKGEPVSPELRSFLKEVYTDILSEPVDLAALKTSLRVLLEYLDGAGRTNANCWAVDLFFSQSDGWERDWTEASLPDDFHDVLAMMGEALHDTVQNPEIAENFDCLPRQLLERVNRLP
jgi:hypothetical protein